jgi:hypothetical protein
LEEIRAERRLLVRDFDRVLARHSRVVQFTPPEDQQKENQWIEEVTQLHRESLAEADALIALFAPLGYARSRASSFHSSRSMRSVASKLLESQRIQEAELRLKHGVEEAEIKGKKSQRSLKSSWRECSVDWPMS